MRASAALLTQACVSLAARGERITTTAVWSHLGQCVPPSAVSRGLGRLEERGVLRRVRRTLPTHGGKGKAYGYALAGGV